MAWVLKMDETVEAGLVQDFDSSLTGIGQELGAAAYSMSDVLALPIFKEEESGLPLEAEAKQPPFQYILCAATSPAVKLHDESLTYLNQGQSYEIRMLDNRKVGDMPEITGKLVRSIIRVVFHDRRLQYTEHQQLEGWKWNRPGDRLLDLDIPVSVGVIDLRTNTDQLNAVEFLWDPAKRTSVFIQIHCISTEFTLRKHGGEKGVPFRVQIDTFKENDSGDYADHLHSASCQIKVFKPKGADRKQKTDREKMEKRTAHEKEKYQPSYDTTILSECSPWPVTSAAYSSDNPAPAPTASTSQHSTHTAPESTATSSNHPGEGIVQISNELLHPSATIQETQQWLLRNRFASYGRLFVNFAGADLLKLTRDDLIQICGAADGIRLDNILKARAIRPRLTMYVCQEQPQVILPENPADGGQGDHGDGAIYIYHAICLEEVTASEVMQKLACTFNVPLHQIHHVFRRGPTGIHILLSDQVVQNFPDESCFFFATIKAENGQGFHIILK